MRRHLVDNAVFLMISLAVLITQPALVNAQSRGYNPVNFTEPLNLSRGSLSPGSSSAEYLTRREACRAVTQEWGWASCESVDAFIIGQAPGLEALVVSKPNSDGYVKFDDWDSGDRSDEIETIWEGFVEGTKEQSRRLGEKITPLEWYVYPTLVKDKSYLYYAILLDWNGTKQINIKASYFDRRGYITFLTVPDGTDYSKEEIRDLVEAALDSYEPKAQQSYFDFKDGDKIAAAGAIGVLATLVGVKYGKGVFAGLFAILLAIFKKAWFLLFLPLIFLKNLVFGRSD